MPQLFGHKLRHVRSRHNLTQTEVAKQLGLASQAHLSNLEQGRFAPSLDLVLVAARLFHVPVDYFLRDAISVEQTEQTSVLPANDPRATGHIAAQVSTLRRQAGMTQAALGTQLGISSHAYISMIEAGRKVPAPDMLVRLAESLNVTVDTLLSPLV